MEEVERVLGLLIHDVRTPLGVALGYVRLIKDNRLPAEADREKALNKAMEALGRISRLCEDATTFLDATDPTPRIAVPATTLIDHVSAQLGAARLRRAPLNGWGHSAIRTSASVDALVYAVDHIVRSLGEFDRRPDAVMSVDAQDGLLRLLVHRQSADSDGAGVPPVDPWRRGYGLGLPVACRTLARAGGQVFSRQEPASPVLITFPLEKTGL